MGWEFQFQVSRHDHHNLEFKYNLESQGQGVEGRIELYFFLPSVIKLSGYSKDDVITDFNARMRLSLPRDEQSAASLERAGIEFENALQGILSVDPTASPESLPEELQAQLLSSVQRLGSAAGEVLKRQKSRHKKNLAEVHAWKLSEEELDRAWQAIIESIRLTHESVTRLQRMLKEANASGLPYIGLVSKYLAHLYIQYLGSIDSVLEEQVRKASPELSQKFAGQWNGVKEVLKEALSAIAQDENNLERQSLVNDARKREDLLLTVSQLKKFFQSSMFVEVSTNQVIKKFTEPAAAAAAGFAAAWAAFFQQFQHPDFMRFGLGGVTFLCLGIAAYILKDRLKDRSKAFLTRKAAQFLPDLEQDLMAQDRRIGRTREWYSLRKPQHVASDVKKARAKYRLSDAEMHLPEQVLHYDNRFHIMSHASGSVGGRWAVKSSLRINFERHLKHLDDPYKAMTLLEEGGTLAKLQAHRVYHFYLVVRTESIRMAKKKMSRGRYEPGETEHLRVFRIVMDKRGIHRVDRLNDGELLSAKVSAMVPVGSLT